MTQYEVKLEIDTGLAEPAVVSILEDSLGPDVDVQEVNRLDEGVEILDEDTDE